MRSFSNGDVSMMFAKITAIFGCPNFYGKVIFLLHCSLKDCRRKMQMNGGSERELRQKGLPWREKTRNYGLKYKI